MKRSFSTVSQLVLAFLLSASLSYAVDVQTKTPPPTDKAASTTIDDKSKAGYAEKKVPDKSKIVDINSATDVELKAVSGIGDAYAAKIIAGRPYANKTQLNSRKILPGPLYEQVKDLLIARQTKK
jgi:DNA uptake protein ComE-like DNA-binding protein